MHPIFSGIHRAIHAHHHGQHAHRHAGRERHRGFFGFDGGHAGFGNHFDAGLGGLGRGRKLGSADLQLLLLVLLAERPSHGYELIKALDDRSNGYYAPSPGMVYPALTYLEEVGYASVEVQGTKKLYSITEAGLTHLERQRASADAMLEQLAWIGAKIDKLRQAMHGDAPFDDDRGDFDSPRAFRGRARSRHADGVPEVRAARRSLKSALIEKSGAPAEEQRRIAAILEQAAAAIRAGAADPG